MAPIRIVILVVALCAAVGAVVVVRGMSKAQPEPQKIIAADTAPAPAKPATQVLVAARDLTPGARIAQGDLAWRAWPQESLNPLYIVQTAAPAPKGEAGKIAVAATDIAKTAVGAPDAQMTALNGAIVREAILANEPIVQRKLVRGGQAGLLAVSLSAGMRAMSVPLNAETGAGGFVLPGDHVDVIQSRRIEGQGPRRVVTQTVLKNVKVLAIDQVTTAPKGASVVGATATLELSPSQSEVLVQAKAQGDLTLVLRSYDDIGGPTITVAERDNEPSFQPTVVKVFKGGSAVEIPVVR